MKKQLLGVTLFEILLVLAIAAMIIVMSVRYYQTSSNSAQINSIMQQIHSITTLADGIAQGAGNYATISTSTLKPLMPNQTMNTMWGGSIDVRSVGNYLYKVTFTQVPNTVCKQVMNKLKANVYYPTVTCTGTTLIYTYDAGIR